MGGGGGGKLTDHDSEGRAISLGGGGEVGSVWEGSCAVWEGSFPCAPPPPLDETLPFVHGSLRSEDRQIYETTIASYPPHNVNGNSNHRGVTLQPNSLLFGANFLYPWH